MALSVLKIIVWNAGTEDHLQEIKRNTKPHLMSEPQWRLCLRWPQNRVDVTGTSGISDWALSVDPGQSAREKAPFITSASLWSSQTLIPSTEYDTCTSTHYWSTDVMLDSYDSIYRTVEHVPDCKFLNLTINIQNLTDTQYCQLSMDQGFGTPPKGIGSNGRSQQSINSSKNGLGLTVMKLVSVKHSNGEISLRAFLWHSPEQGKREQRVGGITFTRLHLNKGVPFRAAFCNVIKGGCFLHKYCMMR